MLRKRTAVRQGGIRNITGTPGNRKLRNRTDGGKFFKAKFVYFFHAASGIPFRVLATFGHLRTHSVECSKLGKTRIIEDARRGVVRNTGFCGQNCRSLFYPELSGICFSEYSSSPILFRYGWRLRGRAGSDAASAGCAALRLARCMPPVMWESAGAASSASIKQARLMESSP